MTHQLLDHRLNQLGKIESLVRLAVPDIFAEHGHCFGVGVGVERVAPLLEHSLELFVVRNDTVVDQAELGQGVGDVRVAVERGGNTVCCPSGVGHGSLGEEHPAHVHRFDHSMLDDDAVSIRAVGV